MPPSYCFSSLSDRTIRQSVAGTHPANLHLLWQHHPGHHPVETMVHDQTNTRQVLDQIDGHRFPPAAIRYCYVYRHRQIKPSIHNRRGRLVLPQLINVCNQWRCSHLGIYPTNDFPFKHIIINIIIVIMTFRSTRYRWLWNRSRSNCRINHFLILHCQVWNLQRRCWCRW